MKNRFSDNIFNIKLYLEGIKRLRLVGFISLAIIMIISALTPVEQVITYREQMHSGQIYHNLIYVGKNFGFLTLMFIIVTPLIALITFNFLTKRNACDCYHSFPQKRKCIFLSLFLSALTWISVIIIAGIAISLIMYAIFSKYFVVPYTSVFLYGFSIFTCCFLVLSAGAAACSVTGTVFTNVIVSGIIIFLPRIFLLSITNMITADLDIFVNDRLFPLADSRYNLIFKTILDLLFYRGESSADNMMFSWPSIIYTLSVALIYAIIAMILFVKRKSETAGSAASGKILQAIIRICVGLTISLLPLYVIIQRYYQNNLGESYDWFYIATAYIIAVFAMLFYELLSTKKAKNIKKILPSTAILAVTNLLIALAVIAVRDVELNWCPDPSDIEYINFKMYTDDNYYDYDSFSYRENYFSYMTGNVKLDNKELLEIVSKSLGNTIEYEKKTLNQSFMKENKSAEAVVTIKSGLFKKVRNIYFTKSDYDKCIALLHDNENFTDIYAELPKYNKNTMSLSVPSFRSLNLNTGSLVKIYNSLAEEVSKLSDPLEWYTSPDMYKNPDGSYTYDFREKINMQFIYNNVATQANLPISQNHTPNTLRIYMEEFNKTYSDIYREDFQKTGINGLSYASIDIMPMSEKYRSLYAPSVYYDYGLSNTAYEKQVIETVSKMSVPDAIDPAVMEKDDTLLCNVCVSGYRYGTGKDVSFSVYTYINKDILRNTSDENSKK